ncbi:PIN domain-containing protein [Rhizobium sp. CB3090]|uniref:PIN domain-containing protein n=1 Tax=Rhizobium sp. CB3090 TaxID=3039156 RepID=UPI0024B21074|nr:PIN domain-containing protein [Rhizobium sp. CB3090]WFU09677.1 PIN domain-containing protein [Rhizobium sp. CB3090]
MRALPPFLDTNVLLYAFTDDQRAQKAQLLLAEPFTISVQALNEFANVARKKLHLPWKRIHEAIRTIVELSTSVVAIDEKTTLSALNLAERYNFSFYDAAMVAAALQANCERYYSEDLHDCLIVETRLTIINPFS